MDYQKNYYQQHKEYIKKKNKENYHKRKDDIRKNNEYKIEREDNFIWNAF